jgi:hypothetical protein
LASEVAVGLALLAAIVFIAAFTSLIREAGRDTLATAVTVSGAAFIALGFISRRPKPRSSAWAKQLISRQCCR